MSEKFQRVDERYRAARAELSEKYGPRELWSVVDHWPLYVGMSNLARVLAIGEILEAQLGVPGHVAEFGSWRGANLLFMAKYLRIHDAFGRKEIHCFDSFEGLTEFVPEDGVGIERAGEYKGSLAELTDMIDLYELDEIEIHRGLIEETLPATLAARPDLSFSLVYCDTDLYQSTKIILDSLHARLVKGGVFVLDEWNHPVFPGEGLAVAEFLDEHGSHYELVHPRNTRQPTLVLKKVGPG